MSVDQRTPEQQAAVVKCKFCDWSRPRFRKFDGGERRDVSAALYWHVREEHPEQQGMVAKLHSYRGDSLGRLRDARAIAGTEFSR